LSSSAVPRAMILPCRPPRSSWRARRLLEYWVVSRSVVPSRTSERMTSHIPSRLRGSSPGRRLVPGTSRRGPDPMSALARSSGGASRPNTS
jgi:hypothetical protein